MNKQEKRIAELEAEGLSTSDAQGVAMAEESKEVLAAFKAGQPIRYSTWYWGKYIKKQGTDRVVDDQGKSYKRTALMDSLATGYEVYEESIHGLANEETV